MKKLLIVDDSDEIRKQLKWGLGKEYKVLQAGNAEEAIEVFKEHTPSVVTLDLGLPPKAESTEEGFRCLAAILAERPTTKVIIISGQDERENTLNAIKSGAYDFYQKPIDQNELRIVIKRAFYLSDIEEENRNLHTALDEKNSWGSVMVAQSPGMLEILSTVRKVATSDVSVLITGDSGTGKELVSREIHAKSLRKDGPFIPINCGAIPENLLESELFGHERGAFTGASSMIQGKFEYAHKGTLFLDEIGELPVSLQVKLLRFLQDKKIQRVGGREDICLDVRIIAATNVDIARSIQEKRFREDLFYRLGVITIDLPPLRDRGADIMMLANFFLSRFNDAFSKKVRGFTPASVGAMESYEWPGNVRELENRLQRAVIMTESTMISPQDMGFGAASLTEAPGGGISIHQSNGVTTLKEARERVEREFITAAIDRNVGNIAKAAEELGISRPTLYDLLKKYGSFKG